MRAKKRRTTTLAGGGIGRSGRIVGEAVNGAGAGNELLLDNGWSLTGADEVAVGDPRVAAVRAVHELYRWRQSRRCAEESNRTAAQVHSVGAAVERPVTQGKR